MKIRKGQLKTYKDASATPQQHRKPCVDCPFGRIALQGWLALMTPEEWLLVAHGEGRMECHTMQELSGQPWQCAGAATFRANIYKVARDDSILILPKNKKLVFATDQEFWDHHSEKPFAKTGAK
jgi:hypothetical protein